MLLLDREIAMYFLSSQTTLAGLNEEFLLVKVK